ncbi:MAG: aldo/keto reductase [Myxococcales bacterium]|nr:aldo/keto reductase [Myxococcales bacterium]
MSLDDTFTLGDLTVPRLGFGAMRICGEGIWGHPEDVGAAKALLGRVVELGIRLVDTADAYGPEVSEYLIAEALHPYRDGLVIATKGGLVRGGPQDWTHDGRPEHLIRAAKNSARRLRLDRIDLYQLHAPDEDVPVEDSLGALKQLQDEGLIRHIGVSNFDVPLLERARKVVDVVSVQNKYNLLDRHHEPVVDYCAAHGIGFIPWYPLGSGDLTKHERLARVAADHDAKPGQIALAWLLQRSPVMLPIPGTSSAKHLEENVAATEIRLSEHDVAVLDRLDPRGAKNAKQ